MPRLAGGGARVDNGELSAGADGGRRDAERNTAMASGRAAFLQRASETLWQFVTRTGRRRGGSVDQADKPPRVLLAQDGELLYSFGAVYTHMLNLDTGERDACFAFVVSLQ